ncbi:hypothetical protein CTI12_AA215070 [Artemisia annua]|uniref:Uncharacterized protein n=1 Tax=Artemisia annua TaxID=35608 RepID=A0A2U1NXF8_ARTAN|nr:hypothetical protein CTI12_AA215070 [Artemisia annua]
MRLSFKIDKVVEPNSRVLDVDNYNVHADVEEIKQTENDSDDESIPEFMDEDDDHDHGLGSGCFNWKDCHVFIQWLPFNMLARILKNYVSLYFKKGSFMKTYHHLINPLSREEQSSRVHKEPLLPPPTRRMPGRPKKKRIRDTTETRIVQGNHRLRKNGSKTTCGICKEEGHNRRSFSLKKDDNDPLPRTNGILPKKSVAQADKSKSKCVYAKTRNKKRINPKLLSTTSATPNVGIEVNTQRSQINKL